jgi:hypothetical protein
VLWLPSLAVRAGCYLCLFVRDDTLIEVRNLMVEIRDLLLPVADAHRDNYERRLAEREEARKEEIRSVLSTPKRKAAWSLADGTLTQREIAKKAGMDEGGASRFFKSLRELGAIVDSPHPTRTVEVTE